MNSDQVAGLVQKLVGGGPWLAIQGMFVIGLVVYLLFAIVILRQTQIMSETIDGTHNGIVRAGAWLHLGLAAFVLVMAILFL